MVFIPYTPQQNDIYTIEKVDRVVSFAGKLGNRIDEELTLSKDGKTIQVRLYRAHTLFGSVKSFTPGEKVTIKVTLKKDQKLDRSDLIKL